MAIFEGILGAGVRRVVHPSQVQPPVVRQPAALPRTEAPSAPAPQAAAVAQLKHAEPAAGDGGCADAAGGEMPPGAVPYRKGAGYWRAGPNANWQKGDGPGTAAEKSEPERPEEKCLVPAEISDEALVGEFRRSQRINVQRAILLGAWSEAWVRQQLGSGRAFDRATAVRKARALIAEARLEVKEARVDLLIRCYWAAVLFGGWRADRQEARAAAQSLSWSALRLFPVLLERERASDRWQIVPRWAEAARALWARAVAERLSAEAVDQAISEIVPQRAVPMRRQRPVRLSVIERLLARLKPADLVKVPAIVEGLSKRAAAA